MIRLKSLLFEYDLNAPGEIEKAVAIVKGLQARGFSYKGAVGLAGNIAHESGCEPNKTEKGGTSAFGLCQWDPGAGRLKALKEFAKMTGGSVGSLATQLDFMKCELIDGYMWNGKPIPNIDKNLMYYKQLDGTYKGLTNFYVKRYNKAAGAGDIAAIAEALEELIFTPQPGSTKLRIENAKKIDQYIKGGSSPAAAKPNTSTTSAKPGSNYTTYPNPASPNESVSITVNKSILPLAAIDLKIIKTTGAQVDSHHWDNVQQGVLKFNAPSEPGVYMLQLSTGKSATDSNIKFMVQ
jgi:hypothetical protein